MKFPTRHSIQQSQIVFFHLVFGVSKGLNEVSLGSLITTLGPKFDLIFQKFRVFVKPK